MFRLSLFPPFHSLGSTCVRHAIRISGDIFGLPEDPCRTKPACVRLSSKRVSLVYFDACSDLGELCCFRLGMTGGKVSSPRWFGWAPLHSWGLWSSAGFKA